MNIWFGFTKVFVNDEGEPVDAVTDWVATAFVLFTHVIYIGEIKHIDEIRKESNGDE